MVLAHRVFRREFHQAADLVLQTRAGELRRAAEIARHVDLVTGILACHHSAEDDYLWPVMLARATMRADVVHRMEYQHERLGHYLDNVEMLLSRWRRTAAASVAGELSCALRQLGKVLAEHLDDEEQHILPLAEQYLSKADWAKLGEIAVAKIPAGQRFTALGLLLEETTAAQARIFLTMMPLAARLRWQLTGRHRYARYITRVHGDALL